MGIIYIFISLILFISIVLVKKSDKKQNILFWIVITLTVSLCYNVFFSYILTIIKLKSTLIALSIVNLLILSLIIFKIYKDKQIQKYYIKLKDIVALIILLVLVIFIGYKQYGKPLEIKYETTDPAIHYYYADTYYRNQQTPAGELKTTMPGAYTNTGILFTVFSDFISDINFYNIYIIFDISILYLIGAMFYIGIVNKQEGISKSIVALIVSIIFILGYPLNSMIFGYSYLSVGILILIAIISMTQYIKNKELNRIIYLIYMFLLVYGIFFTYYFFVPIMYASLGLYILFDMIKNRKKKNILSIFTKQNVIDVIIILIIPTILGFCYFMLPSFISGENTDASYIVSEGYCYRDLYSNFIFFIPFALYYCINKIKNKENSFLNISFIITTIFTVLLLYIGLKGKASSYYYFKTYFLISILLMQMTVKSIYNLIDNKLSIYAYAFLITFLGILYVGTTQIDTKITQKNLLFNPVPRMNSYVDIYLFNYTKLNSKTNILTNSQINAIKFLKEKDANKENTKIYGHILQMLWLNSTVKLTESTDVRELQIPIELDVEGWTKDNNKKYYLCLDVNDKINKQSDKYKIIYEEDDVIILEK